MLGVVLAENQLEKIVDWLSEFQGPSGWYYNLGWANTKEHLKLQNEVTLQTLCAVFAIQSPECRKRLDTYSVCH